MAGNPFTFDRPVAPEALVDREREIETLLRRLEDATSTRLSSPRRFGKTSLLRRVLRDAEHLGMASVYVDFYGVTTMGQVLTRIERAYEQQLIGALARAFAALRRTGTRVRVDTPLAGVEAAVAASPEVERALLESLDLPLRLHRKTGTRIAIAFDEFQAVLGARDQIDALMRSVIQHHGEAASYVFAGSHPGLMAALFGERDRPFFGQAAPLVLEPLPQEPLADHLGHRFEAGGRRIDGALGWLLDLARGHPQRAMLLAHLLWEEVGPGGTADEEAWSRVLEKVGGVVQDDFESTWNALSATERAVLDAVASETHGLTSRSTLARFGLTKGAAPRAAERLAGAGLLLLDRTQPTGYSLVDPLLERWIEAGRRWE